MVLVNKGIGTVVVIVAAVRIEIIGTIIQNTRVTSRNSCISLNRVLL